MNAEFETMPRLQILRGDTLSRSFELDRESTTLGSDFGTQTKGQKAGGPVRLRGGDLIQVGDCLFRFSGSLVEVRDEDQSRSAILGVLDAVEASGRHLAGSRPEVKLRALLEIGQELANILD